MKVTVSVFGRFHAFYLAHQLLKNNCLKQLITSYPTLEVEKYGIPEPYITSLISHEMLRRVWQQAPSFVTQTIDPNFYFCERFDKAAKKRLLEGMDIFVGWSGFSLNSLQKAKQFGAITILERGSSHIEFQQEILAEEYQAYGCATLLPSAKLISKEKKEYRAADYICVPSSFAKQTFVAKGVPAEKLLQVPYGVDLTQFRQVPSQDTTFRVIFAGSLTLRKGVHYLLQAFSELKLPDSELWLAGKVTPEIKPFLKKYRDKIRLLGHVPQSKLHQYYSQCSVFTMCSLEEGMAMVQPQAMACGLPLICTSHTGGEDLIDNSLEGFVIPIRDINILKEKLLYLYENREHCYEMGQAAKRKVQHGLTWDDYGDNIMQEYRRISASKSK